MVGLSSHGIGGRAGFPEAALIFPVRHERPPAVIKTGPEDFLVREVGDAPAGSGKFWWVRVTKRAMTTPEMLARIADHYGIHKEEVGTAGYKDRWAITTQRLSLPARCAEGPGPSGFEGWEPLGFHPEPLKPGQLHGNEFAIVVREADLADLGERWKNQAEVGWANYYGIQRFGPTNNNWATGLEMLKNPPPKHKRKRWPHNFVINSVQSQLFNRFLEKRIREGKFEETEYGPIWGYKLSDPTPDELEVLREAGLTPESFRPFRAPGTRRMARLRLPELSLEDRTVRFVLPPGAYATVLLEHFFELPKDLSDSAGI